MCFRPSESLPKNHVGQSKLKLREKCINTQQSTFKIRLKPLYVLHGRVVALSKGEIIRAMAGGNDPQSQPDKAIGMASDRGMLFGAVADDYGS